MLEGMLRSQTFDVEFCYGSLAFVMLIEQSIVKRSGESQPAAILIVEKLFAILIE